jgi:hypothetical protein
MKVGSSKKKHQRLPQKKKKKLNEKNNKSLFTNTRSLNPKTKVVTISEYLSRCDYNLDVDFAQCDVRIGST